jgi:pimeloyl-ACP methyl ester carboxylesterase
MRFARIIGLLPFLFACATRPPALAPEVAHSAVLFVPGIYGTALVDSEGAQLFLTVEQALWGTTPLALVEPDLGVQGAKPLKAAGLLTGVPIIPWLYAIDGYGAAEDYLIREFGRRNSVLSMPYDWRQDNFIAVQALDALVQKLKARGVMRIALVSHSMGGLITGYYLRYGAQPPETAVENWAGAKAVQAAVFVGVPFGGAVQSFHNLLHGTSLGTAETPLAALSLGTFPSMYQLMPAEDMGSAINVDGHPLADPFRDFALWKKLHWGLLQFPAPAPLLTKRENVMETYLRRAQAFSRKLRAPAGRPSAHPLPALVVQGEKRSTPARVQWRAKTMDQTGGWDFSTGALEADGDGVVTVASSHLPAGFDSGLKYSVAFTYSSHTEQLYDCRPRSTISGFLHSQGF